MQLNLSSSYYDRIHDVDNYRNCGPSARAARCMASTIIKLVNNLNNVNLNNNDTPPHNEDARGQQPSSTTEPPVPLPSGLSASVLLEDTAGALVGFVRLSLVILICVLLVKLRSVKKGQRQGGKESPDGDSYVQLVRKSNHHDRETKISGVKQVDRSNEFNLADARQNSNKQQQIRRHSQAAAGPPDCQRQQCAVERRRRHSDTTAAISSLQLPPGPMGLPFLGYLPFLGNEIHLTLTDLSHKFGPIYQIFLGGIRVVVLNDAALVRQAFKQTVFSGRPDTQLTRILQGYGIVNSEGALWKEQRAFLHSALRKLGAKSLMSGSNGLEAKIQVSLERSAVKRARWCVEVRSPFGTDGATRRAAAVARRRGGRQGLQRGSQKDAVPIKYSRPCARISRRREAENRSRPGVEI
jgi:hypothetical protein